MSYNKIILVGFLSRDIELRYTQGGMAIANTGLATSRKFTVNGEKKEEVCFVDVTFFARSAEVANQYLRKGSKILVEGRLSFDQWVDQNGQKRSKHSVVVETMQMLDSKGASQPESSNDSPPPYREDAPTTRYSEPEQKNAYYRDYDGKPDINYTAYKESKQKEAPKSADGLDLTDEEIPF